MTLDDYEPPSLRDRLLHPVSISGLIVVLLVGGWWGWSAYREHQRQALDEVLAPLQAEWDELRAQGRAHAEAIEAALLEPPTAGLRGCAELEGPVGVAHRPMLQLLAAGERFPRVDGPLWLSSPSYAYLSETTTPSRDEGAHRRRLEVVRAELGRTCVAVLETAHAESPTPPKDGRFEGGVVVGTLRVVCPDDGGLRCEAPLFSAPMFAVSVTQRDRSAQGSADRMAVSSAAQAEYWDAVAKTLGGLAPRLTVEAEPSGTEP